MNNTVQYVLHIDLTILNKHTRSLTGTVSKLLRLKSSSLPSSLSFKLSFGILGFKVKVQRRPEPAVNTGAAKCFIEIDPDHKMIKSIIDFFSYQTAKLLILFRYHLK